MQSGGGLCASAKQEIFFRPIDKYRIITTGTEKYFKIRAVIYSVSFVPYNMRHGNAAAFIARQKSVCPCRKGDSTVVLRYLVEREGRPLPYKEKRFIR